MTPSERKKQHKLILQRNRIMRLRRTIVNRILKLKSKAQILLSEAEGLTVRADEMASVVGGLDTEIHSFRGA
jgi:hypothetical protein